MRRSWELAYPIVFATLIIIPVLLYKWDLSNVKNISSILSSGVTIGAIVIAFLATMISILISISNVEVMKRINKNDAEGDLILYIEVTIISGFILAIYSLVLNAFIGISGSVSHALFTIFVWILTFFIFSSYRIIHIFSRILNQVLKENKPPLQKTKTFNPHVKE